MTLWEEIERALGGPMFAFGELLEGRLDPMVTAGVGWAAVDALIANSNFEKGMVKVVPAKDIDPALWTAEQMGTGGIIERTPRRGAFTELLQRGATLVMNKADRADSNLRNVVERLGYVNNETSWVNGYACWTSDSAFGRHCDTHDTVIVQVEGTKHWKVFRGSGPDAELAMEKTLVPGDVLHVPIGWDHQVTGMGAATLHWTFGVTRTGPEKAAGELLDYGWSRHQLASLSDEEVVREVQKARGELSGSRRRGMSLPWAIEGDELRGASIRWAGRFKPSVAREEGRILLRGLGKAIRLPSSAESVVQVLAHGGQLRASALTADERTLLATLLSAGLVIAAHE